MRGVRNEAVEGPQDIDVFAGEIDVDPPAQAWPQRQNVFDLADKRRTDHEIELATLAPRRHDPVRLVRITTSRCRCRAAPSSLSRRLGPGDVILETRTHPSDELRRHVSQIANDPGSKDRILFGRRELLELRCSPDPLCHDGDRSPIDRGPIEAGVDDGRATNAPVAAGRASAEWNMTAEQSRSGTLSVHQDTLTSWNR